MKEIPSKEGRLAAMALFCRQIPDAEAILLQSGLIYRAIQMNIDLFNWERFVTLSFHFLLHNDFIFVFHNDFYLLRESRFDDTGQRCLSSSVLLLFSQFEQTP